ncbi:monosaccharide ABC transporter substrate-binding protein, CUT2 family [Haloechinothrix alba]|uniref:Monosaccharide ABC transporter substrate-binding protein, CUT2 family n=1 Tax=Haloechinothrix alba TaxID=664784 RepID=A0A238W4R7_9PSEU|nr:substrate-binding domain-containing protein [Haloechinothrix alba]SNR40709.1 monosaccharide ABC transporter substrate-binding protein, CUT2 family [Haloechinothrix alba]
MTHTIRRAGLAATLAGALAVATACSSEGGQQAQEQAVEKPELDVALITHAVPGDTFWDIVRAGAEDAAAKSNINLQYHGDPEVREQANLVDNAIDQGVDGIALTLATPEGLEDAVQRANDAGIPVVGLNSGIEDWEELGVLQYFGTDEALAGTAFGERLSEETDAEKTLCVIQEQGHVALETRCGSLADAFDGDTEKLYVDGSDMPSVQSGIQAKLQEDSEIDYVVTLGAPYAMTALDSVNGAGSDATVATFDLNTEAAEAIKDGDIEFAVDQQPYLQGYLAIDSFWLYAHNGNYSGGGEEPVLTGPAFVDSENIDEIAEFAAEGTR